MLTRAEILQKVETRLLQVKQSELVWGDIVAAVGGADTASKVQIVNAIKGKDGSVLSNLIFDLIADKVSTDARSEAASLMADDSLSLTDLQRIF